MSEPASNSTSELSCPNCGASYALPVGGNQVQCAYCGSRFLIPESIRTPATPFAGFAESAYTPTRIDVRRWVRWLIIFVVVVTVVPTVCGLAAAFCGVLAPLIAIFA